MFLGLNKKNSLHIQNISGILMIVRRSCCGGVCLRIISSASGTRRWTFPKISPPSRCITSCWTLWRARGHCYLLLDEIQEITGWERAINSLLEGTDADIYVTGSNSKLMSSEISTYLTGRYVSIPVYTLSFREYLFFFRTNFGFPTKIAKQTAAIACPTTLLAITSYQKSFHFLNQVLLQIGRIYAIIKVQ